MAALVLAGGALLCSAPASSAATPSGAWDDPAPAGTVDDIPVAYLQAPQRLGGWAEFDQGIAGVAFTLVKDAADPADACSAAATVKPQSAPGGDGRVEFAFDAAFPCNRRYQVRATVAPAQKPLRRDTPLVLNLWVAVAVPAAPTTGLSADVGGDRIVGLRWDGGAHEPDFEGYEIRRSVDGRAFTPIDEVGPALTTYADHGVPAGGGDVRYQVVGMRPGPDAGTTVYADAGSPASVTVPAVAGASGGGGSGGGTARVPTVAGGGTVTPTGSGQQSAHRVFQAPTGARSTTPTTADTGFQETLPFQPPAGGDAAVVARLDDGDDGGQRETLLLIAGASTAFSWAMALRFLTRRAAVGF
ncbi:MAG: hypothetical protein JWN67_5102 [Actinomycetia bacterium]|nr:hypothetical protein [Actinomycetes bacterium]